MDELLELMDHHTQIAKDGVTFCTNIYTIQFRTIAANALDSISKCS